MGFPKKNNLQWLRLIFAVQVVLEHAHTHMGLAIPTFLKYFPGVPAFFFVSGFLIYASWENAPGIQYFINRFLRLWPALAVVTLGGLAVVTFARTISGAENDPLIYLSWFAAQTTLGQTYNPAAFRDVGVGVINGALWTITVEILFYISVPIISFLNKLSRFAIPAITLASFLVYSILPSVLGEVMIGRKSLYDFLAITPIVWGWMFGFGILAFKYYPVIKPFLRAAPIPLIIIFILIWIGLEGPLFHSVGNEIGLVYFIAYIWLIMWFAFDIKSVDLKTDLSYGIYIWHMPIINFMLEAKLTNATWVLPVTALVAAISWFLIENPSLKLKRKTINTTT